MDMGAMMGGGGTPPMGAQGPGGQGPVDQAQMGQGQPMLPSGGPPQIDPKEQEDDDFENYLNYALSEANLAKNLSSKKKKALLLEMGQEIHRGVTEDINSRQEWEKQNREWLDMALLVRKNKTFPFPKASNTKYPLLATAAMQFSARAYPALVPADGNVVKAKVTQGTPTKEVFDSAKRIAHFMSYQLMEKIPNWEEDMDKLLLTMAITGVCFKETYHNSALNCHESQLVFPEDFIVNYNAKSLEKAYRKTKVLRYTENEYQEKVRNNQEYLELDLSAPGNADQQEDKTTFNGDPPPADKSTPHVFWACHTYWDLDDDGYEEPYVIVIHKDTKQVVRIIARWDLEGVKKNDDDQIMFIQPVEYFTAFPFIPNPDGSIYGLGFGMLLSPLNESVNTIINQLTDAGSLSNMQSGFIGKGLRLKMGETTFKLGEWKVVNATGDDLKSSIFPLPAREPSPVLFQLLNLLITSGNQLASIAEIFVGKMPGQNTPAGTTQEAVQQGMAVFTAIYKRVYRSLAQEFLKLYRLNKICPDIVSEESKLAGIPLQVSDFMLPSYMIVPGADPVGDSVTVKMAKMEKVGSLISMGTINPQVFTQRILEGLDVVNPQELIAQPPPPQPDPKAETEKLKQQGVAQEIQGKMAYADQAAKHKEALFQVKAAMETMKLEHAKELAALKANSQASSVHADQVAKATDTHYQAQKAALDITKQVHSSAAELSHQREVQSQELAHGAQKHRQQLKQQKAATPKGKKKPK